MEIINELNKIGDLQFKEFKNIKTLEINREYKIESFERIKSKFGYQIICNLEDFKVSLPRRFVEKMDDKIIKELNKKNLKLVYKGIQNIKDKEICLINFV